MAQMSAAGAFKLCHSGLELESCSCSAAFPRCPAPVAELQLSSWLSCCSAPVTELQLSSWLPCCSAPGAELQLPSWLSGLPRCWT